MVTKTHTGYSATADELTRRIADLIPSNPQIMDDGFSAWDLFNVPGFKCDDLAPSLFQASWSLKKAREMATAVTVSAPDHLADTR